MEILKNKKVLVVSPTPSHPQNAGNRARIYGMLKELKRQGYEIHFVYDDRESYNKHVKKSPDIPAMSQEWDRFYYSSPLVGMPEPVYHFFRYIGGKAQYLKKPFYLISGNIWRLRKPLYLISGNIWRIQKIMHNLINLPDRIIGICGLVLKRNIPSAYRIIKPYFPDKKASIVILNERIDEKLSKKQNKQNKVNNPINHSQIDDWYNFKLDRFIKKLHEKNNYDFVVAEYVFMSRVLNNFDDKVIKIIDTHDVFTDRNEKYAKMGINESFFSTTKEEESRGLNRADRIIAIQENEAEFFRGVTDKPIFTIGHFVEQKGLTIKSYFKKTILFIGAGNLANIDAAEKFILNIFPLVKKRIPECQLVLAGNMCSFIKDYEDVVKLGEVDNLNTPYEFAGVVINPTGIGTGLKIKNIEALGQLRPLILSKHSAEGLDSTEGAFLVAEDDNDFSEKIVRVLSDEKCREELISNAQKFIKKYNQNNLVALRKCFSKSSFD